MGKANRIKSEKATNTLAAPTKSRNAKKGMPTWAGTAIVVAVLVLLVAFAAVSVMNSRGTFKRMHVIAETENFKVTVPMMSYLVHTEHQAVVATYEQYSQQLNTTLKVPAADSTGTALDSSVMLRDQIYQVKTNDDGTQTTITWFDHFAELAQKDLAKILACCEYAYALNIELTKTEKESIDERIDAITEYAEQLGYSTNGYFATMYGDGVIAKDVRAMMELQELADKYSSIRSDEILNAIGDPQVEEQYNNNKSKYDTYIDYIGYTFSVSFKPTDASAEGAEATNANKKAEYEAKQTKYATYAAELYAATTSEEFSRKLLVVLQEMFRDEEREALLAKKDAGATLTAEEEQTCTNNAQTRALAAVEEARVENYNTSDLGDTVLSDWLTDSETPRKADDKLKDETVYDVYGNKYVNGEKEENANSTTYAEATSAYSVYFTTSALHRDSGFVRSAGHVLFASDTYDNLKSSDSLTGVKKLLADRILKRGAAISAKEMAVELTTLMMEEGKLTQTTNAKGETIYTIDESIFKAYGENYTDDSNVFYDDVTQGQMMEGFENWLFDGDRVVGEISYPGGVETDYGYHVMLYRGDNKPAWSHTIRVELASGQYEAWLTAAQAEYPVVYGDSDLWNKIAD